VPVTSGSKPARRSASANGVEIDSSSSTTKMRRPVLVLVGITSPTLGREIGSACGSPTCFARSLPAPFRQLERPLAQSRRNFEVVSILVNPGDPDTSRLLLHPLAPEGGGDVFHSGGRQFASKRDPAWRTLAAWVNGATLASQKK